MAKTTTLQTVSGQLGSADNSSLQDSDQEV